MVKNQFHLLRDHCLAESTKAFTARGKSVVRCELCQLAAYACICPWTPKSQMRTECVLLLHRNELFKPTNTGRLIADIFPHQTHAFCWDRTQPSPALVEILNDPRRQCFIVFPADEADSVEKSHAVHSSVPVTDKLTTFILLDGTWKQSGRMFHLSRWLDGVPCIALPEGNLAAYAVRKSHQDHYLSTAEAAALCLELAGEQAASKLLIDYFQLFNAHYLATRGCYPPEIGELHTKLAAFKP